MKNLLAIMLLAFFLPALAYPQEHDPVNIEDKVNIKINYEVDSAGLVVIQERAISFNGSVRSSQTNRLKKAEAIELLRHEIERTKELIGVLREQLAANNQEIKNARDNKRTTLVVLDSQKVKLEELHVKIEELRQQ